MLSEQHQKIMDYIEGNLSAKEKDSIKKEMENSPSFKEEFKFTKLLFEGINEKEKRRISNNLKEINNSINVLDVIKYKPIIFSLKIWQLLLIGVILLTSGVLLFQNPGNQKPNIEQEFPKIVDEIFFEEDTIANSKNADNSQQKKKDSGVENETDFPSVLAVKNIQEFRQYYGIINDASFSPDGTLVLTCGVDRTAKIWSIKDLGEPKSVGKPFQHESTVYSAIFSHSGNEIMTSAQDGVRLWSISGKLIYHFKQHESEVHAIAFSENDSLFLSGDFSGRAFLWNRNGEIIKTFPHHASVFSVSFSNNGNFVLTGSWDKTATLWDIRTGDKIQSFSRPHTGEIHAVAFSHNDSLIFTCGLDDRIVVWERGNQEPLQEIIDTTENKTGIFHNSDITAVDVSSDGKHVVTGSRDNSIILWGVSNKRLEKIKHFSRIGETDEVHSSDISSVQFSPDGTNILTSSWGGKAILWDFDGKAEKVINKHDPILRYIAFSKSRDSIISVGSEKTFSLLSSNGSLIKKFPGHEHGVYVAAYSPDGKYVASGSGDNTAAIWSINSGKKLKSLVGHKDRISGISFSSDSKTLLTGSDDNSVILWSINGEKLLEREFYKSKVTAISASPNGMYFGIGYEKGDVVIMDSLGKEVDSFKNDTTHILAISFSKDNKFVITGSLEKANVWNVNSHELISIHSKQRGGITGVDFSYDGKYYLTASVDGSIIVWNNGNEMLNLKMENPIVKATFTSSSSSSSIIAGTQNGVYKIWELGFPSFH